MFFGMLEGVITFFLAESGKKEQAERFQGLAVRGRPWDGTFANAALSYKRKNNYLNIL